MGGCDGDEGIGRVEFARLSRIVVVGKADGRRGYDVTN